MRVGKADLPHGANVTFRDLRHAHARAELHEALRKRAAVSLRVNFLQALCNAFFDGGQVDGLVLFGNARGNAQHVAVHRRHTRFKADRADRPRGVVPDAGQGAHRIVISGEFPAELGNNKLCRLLQIARAGILAQALPQLQKRFFGCFGKIAHSRKRL